MDRSVVAKDRQLGRFLAVAVVVAATLLFLSERIVAAMAAERRSIEAAASNKLLYDSEILARSLDGLLRLADAAIVDISEAFAPPDPRSSKDAAVEAARRVPESQNAYVLDGAGAVVASAWFRTSLSLALPAGTLDRLVLTGMPETLVAEASGDGGACLATVSVMKGRGRFLAIIFPATVLEGRTSLLKEQGEEAATVEDAYSRVLAGPHAAASGPRGAPARLLASETAMAYHPLKVRIERDLGPTLDKWRDRLVRESCLVLILVIASTALFLIALSARRKAAKSVALEGELRAKELLFHEANHRIKNNLSVVCSILSLGEAQVEEDPASARATLAAASEKVTSIAMLHEYLYRRRSTDDVELGPYLAELASELSRTYLEGRKARIEVEADEDAKVDLRSAVPIALIVTELVTNACKYAFPDGREGRIGLSASVAAGGVMMLRIEDDGIWDGSEEAGMGGDGFGLDLVDALVEQLGAKLTKSIAPAGHGLACCLEIPPAAKLHADATADGLLTRQT